MLTKEQLLNLKGIGGQAVDTITMALEQYEKSNNVGIIEKEIVLNYINEKTAYQEVAGIAFCSEQYQSDIAIENIGLKSRFVASLKKAGITTAKQVVYMDCNSIKCINGIGEISFNDIVEKLKPITRIQFVEEPLSDNIQIVLEDISKHCIGLNDVTYFVNKALENCERIENILDDRDTMEQIYLKSPMKGIMEVYICHLCDMKETTNNEIINKLPLGMTKHGIEKEIINGLLKAKKLLKIEKDMFMYFPTILNLAQMLEEGKQKISLLYRLQGKSLNEISEIMGVTPERVRQLSMAAINKISNIREDKFSYWYQNYDIPSEQFKQKFGLSEESYNYLKIRYKKEKCNKGNILADKNITHRIAERIKQLESGNL